MIVPILVMLSALATLTASLLTAELSAARAARDDAVSAAAETALSLGQAQLLAALAQTVAGNLAAGSPAGAGIDGTFARTTPATQAPGSHLLWNAYEQVDGITTDPFPGPDTAENLQTSALAQETRLSAVVSIEVHGPAPAAALLAKRTRLVTVRLFAVAPYAIVDGSRDLATEDASVAAEGDAAGVPALPGDAATPDPTRPGAYRDTTIKIRYPCAGPDTSGPDPGDNGKPWGGSPGAIDEPCDPTSPPWANGPGPPAVGAGDRFTPAPWANSNGDLSGWSR